MRKLVIETDNLRHNIVKVKEYVANKNTKIIAVVKSNGYGLRYYRIC